LTEPTGLYRVWTPPITWWSTLWLIPLKAGLRKQEEYWDCVSLFLIGGGTTLVDSELFDYLIQWNWSVCENGAVYALGPDSLTGSFLGRENVCRWTIEMAMGLITGARTFAHAITSRTSGTVQANVEG
jgi:hypothetical protein